MFSNSNYETYAVSGMQLTALAGNVALKGNYIELQSHLAFSSGVTQADIRSDLGLVIGGSVQPYSAVLDTVATSVTNKNMLIGNGSNYVSTAPADVRSNLGLVIGTDVQPQSARLNDLATADVSVDNFLVGNGSTFVSKVKADAVQSLGLTIGTQVQAHNAGLDVISGLNHDNNYVISGDGNNSWKMLAPSDLLADINAQPKANVLSDISVLGEPSSANQLMYSTSSSAFGYTPVTPLGMQVIACNAVTDVQTCLGLTNATASLTLANLVSGTCIISQSPAISYFKRSEANVITNGTASIILASIPVSPNELIYFNCTVVGKNNSVAPRVLIQKYSVAVTRASGNNVTLLTSTGAVQVYRSTGVTASTNCVANTSTQALNITVAGETGVNWNWTCQFDYSDVLP